MQTLRSHMILKIRYGVMTIQAGHVVNVMGTLTVPVGCVHGHHVQAAAGYSRVTFFTGIPCIIGVPLMTGTAGNSLMNTHRCPVILAPCLVFPVGGMALHTDALHRVVRYQYPLFSIIHFG